MSTTTQVYLDFWPDDDEVLSDDIFDPGPEHHEFELGPGRLASALHRTCTRAGVRLGYEIDVRLLGGDVVDVRVDAVLFGRPDDLDGIGAVALLVQPDESGAAAVEIGSAGRLVMSVRNVAASCSAAAKPVRRLRAGRP